MMADENKWKPQGEEDEEEEALDETVSEMSEMRYHCVNSLQFVGLQNRKRCCSLCY